MALEKIEHIEGKGVYVQGNDIDTDRIIPARFMKCVTFDGLGEFLFYDVHSQFLLLVSFIYWLINLTHNC